MLNNKSSLKVRIVLVRPRNPLNIGAAARAMSNFGFEDMVVVDPYEPVWRQTVSAVGAESVVLKARAVKTFAEAVSDCELVLGTTDARTRRLVRTLVRLPELNAYLPQNLSQLALVFGSEKTGLSTAVLEQCNAYLTIPTSDTTPSMNLSHAIAVCCYELSQKDAAPSARIEALATAENRERLAQHALELFNATGFLGAEPAAQKIRRIRHSLLQWNLHRADIGLLHGIVRHLMVRVK